VQSLCTRRLLGGAGSPVRTRLCELEFPVEQGKYREISGIRTDLRARAGASGSLWTALTGSSLDLGTGKSCSRIREAPHPSRDGSAPTGARSCGWRRQSRGRPPPPAVGQPRRTRVRGSRPLRPRARRRRAPGRAPRAGSGPASRPEGDPARARRGETDPRGDGGCAPDPAASRLHSVLRSAGAGGR
jgi:hypothetical protein